jgi:hypothetical protein
MDTNRTYFPASSDEILVTVDRSPLPLAKNTVFVHSRSTADPGDHYEVLAGMILTISNPNFALIINYGRYHSSNTTEGLRNVCLTTARPLACFNLHPTSELGSQKVKRWLGCSKLSQNGGHNISNIFVSIVSQY